MYVRMHFAQIGNSTHLDPTSPPSDHHDEHLPLPIHFAVGEVLLGQIPLSSDLGGSQPETPVARHQAREGLLVPDVVKLSTILAPDGQIHHTEHTFSIFR